MQFWITIKNDWKEYRYLVVYQRAGKDLEQFTVKARNKQLMFTRNRPLLKNKGIRHRQPDIKLYEGQIFNQTFLQKIIDHLQAFS